MAVEIVFTRRNSSASEDADGSGQPCWYAMAWSQRACARGFDRFNEACSTGIFVKFLSAENTERQLKFAREFS